MINLKEKILNLIYPPVCGFCNRINSDFLCDRCKNKLNSMKISMVDNYIDAPVYFDEHFFMFKYEKEIREEILKYKFDEKSYMYKSYAKILFEDNILRSNFIDKYDCIISVPIHKRRFKERGYNQSELIARELSLKLGKKYYSDILIKNKNIVAQSSLDRLNRVRNIMDAFVFGKNINHIRKKNVVLFDDVFTTGATVNECARVLKEAGANFVGVLTIAKS